MKQIYQWRPGTVARINAQLAGERLEEVREANGGLLTPKAVVDDARPEQSPLHPAFEWDDGKAAELYREDQARALIRHLAVTVPEHEETRPVRAFVHVEQTATVTGYLPVMEALSDPQYRAQVLGRAFSELRAWQERYREYNELAKLFAAIDDAEKQLGVG